MRHVPWGHAQGISRQDSRLRLAVGCARRHARGRLLDVRVTPEPADAARALAAGLSTGDLAAVTFKGTTPAKATAFVKAAYKDLGTLRPQVSLGEMSHAEGSDRATATLVSRWDVSTSPTDWTYKTQVPLTLVDGRWQVSWTPGVVAPQLTADETLDVARKWPQRADIVDSAGGKIMTEREVAAVGIDKTKVSGAEATASAKALAALIGIDPARFAAKVGAAGAKAFVQGVTLRQTDPVLERNGAAIAKVKGALTVPTMQVLGPSRTWAAPILGTVGEANAEQVKASKGTLEAGDSVGQTGPAVPLRRAAARHPRPRRPRRQARRRRQHPRQA